MQMGLGCLRSQLFGQVFCICVSITRCDWVSEEKAVTGKAKTYRFGKSLSILRGDFLGQGVVNGEREEHMQIRTKHAHATALLQHHSEQAGRLLDQRSSLMKRPRKPRIC